MKRLPKQSIRLFLILALAAFLRFYHLPVNPPGLYIDEANIGYNAYKILTTGKDEYGIPHPLFFKSFGDYKMPVYIYATAGAMAIFGKNEFAVRVTSASAGVLAVFVVYLFVKELITKTRKQLPDLILRYLPILSAFLLAISPWHLQFSRGGFEVNLALTIFLLALLFAVRFITTQRFWFLLCSFFLFAVTLYTYHTYRILSPLVVLGISAVYFFRFSRSRLKIAGVLLLFIVLIIPIAQFTFTPQGSERFSATSAFSEYPTKTFTDKMRIYPLVLAKNYLSFYSFDFLFNFGDGIGRHQLPNFGELPRWTLPFFFIGFFILLKQRRTAFALAILVLLIMVPLPAIIARPSPHALRDLLFVVPAMITIALGMLSMLSHTRKSWIKYLFISIGCFAVYETLFYFHHYYDHYPKVNIIDWGGGYKQVVVDATEFAPQHKKIVIDSNLGSDVLAYFHFYNESLQPIVISSSWQKPKEWTFPVLYIRPSYGQQYSDKIIHTVFLPTVNKDIFAQFWQL